jgi:hypothetical protein
MLGRFVDINRIVARRLKMDESLVGSVTSFFVKELNTELKECNHPFIYVRGLGTFTLVVGAIETRLRTLIRKYWVMRNDPAILKSDKNFVGLHRVICELFTIRRVIKTRRYEMKLLKDARKTATNN